MDASEITVLLQRMRSHGLRLDVERGCLVATTDAGEAVMPAFLKIINENSLAVLRNLRPDLACSRAAQTARLENPKAWDAAGYALERIRKAAEPITPAGAGNPTRRPQNGTESQKKREGQK